MFIELVDKKLEGVFDVEQFCLDNNIDAKKVKSLDCSDNQLTEIKGLDKLVNLEWLWCNDNNLTELNTSKLVNLLGLYCRNNELSELDVSKLVNLERLYCSNNKLTELNVGNLVNLKDLNGDEFMQPEPEPEPDKLDLILSKIEKLEQIILDNKR